ncbi:MAG: hypothetical protein A2W91_00855 [Bacteroidetes bacterium GWF2_38_335]|nr:MAG: hypothetical protein A2W91_00855 [Bacteroidetes bacterium GWF2_38_335]OFY80305.1 MAG: hypothetical protein A2281_17365 [Bacteroidetes bacterium RIFOXYA12_FULL_38_20]HBS88896.1 peptidase M17 [Bacteroidales bacterium]
MKLTLVNTIKEKDNLIILAGKKFIPDKIIFSKRESDYIKERIKKDDVVIINQYKRYVYVVPAGELKKEDPGATLEKARDAAGKIVGHANKKALKSVVIKNETREKDITLAFAEGMVLSNYQFLKYFSKSEKKKNSLTEAGLLDKKISKKDFEFFGNIMEGIAIARDLTNEPLSYLTAQKLSQEIDKLAPRSGFSVEIFDHKKIESLKMGGLLAINRGSIDPPTFTTIEWKAKNAVNKNPVVLVGKGVVFDTGGLSLKPTDSMDYMKSDMAGAAAVTGTIFALARSKMPLWVVALIPATDNRPGENAVVPGDVVTMHDGTTVEVLNTDAEGRMILADALSYAKRFKPMLVIDIATLTGSANQAVGPHGIPFMGTANKTIKEKLTVAGDLFRERLIEFPLWNEYGEMIKSSIADIKNTGGKTAGMITAGKFLEHFTDYPWIHIDIAGQAFKKTNGSYLGKGATGVGVRLLSGFLNKISEK